ncbi:MAG: TetR/AcrR family transcriptional regulator [Pseudomonadota bacterium]
MTKLIQRRSIETRARLLAVARTCAAEVGYGGLRADDVARRAGVAKGTFFAHFADKDVLLNHLIGAEMDRLLDIMEASPAPRDSGDISRRVGPLLTFLASDRYVFDVVVRHSGATARDEIGPIAQAFHRHAAICMDWLERGSFRDDVTSGLLAHGIQAFMIHAVALEFCALHSGEPIAERFEVYLQAWLGAQE